MKLTVLIMPLLLCLVCGCHKKAAEVAVSNSVNTTSVTPNAMPVSYPYTSIFEGILIVQPDYSNSELGGSFDFHGDTDRAFSFKVIHLSKDSMVIESLKNILFESTQYHLPTTAYIRDTLPNKVWVPHANVYARYNGSTNYERYPEATINLEWGVLTLDFSFSAKLDAQDDYGDVKVHFSGAVKK